jgi:peptidoglycan hydrolase-like protein with peptidoglycan-binding domain
MDKPPEALFHGEGLSMDVKMDKFGAVAVAVLLSATLVFGASTSSKKPSTNPAAKIQNTSHHAHHSSKKARKGRVRGQKAIDGDRVRQIQEALIREHYLKGEPSGKWDAATQQALHRYQSDQGWQSKTVPDSRALIRLGLGPDSEHLLNPESAMTMSPATSTQHTTSRSAAKVSSVSMSTTSNSMPGSSVQGSVPAASMSNIPTR